MHALGRRVLRHHASPFRSLPPRALSASSESPLTPSAAAAEDEDEWDAAWEAAWLPKDHSARDQAPWEPAGGDAILPPDADADARAFVEEMDESWDERRAASRRRPVEDGGCAAAGRRDPEEEYRLRKQRIHASMWMREIEKLEESRHRAVDGSSGTAEIDRLLDSCSEIFDSGNDDLNDMKVPGSIEFKSKPDGWESTSKTADGNIWEVTQHEEDILMQEYERRIAFNKFQIASFIKTHIFSRRRPIDGWKYMIEVIGPNARKNRGSVQRLPAVSDPATQPFQEEHTAIEFTRKPLKR